MPSKKKNSKTPLKLSYSSDQSSPSHSSSSLTRSNSELEINLEDISRSLLEQASIKFPLWISKDAFIGKIAEVDSNKGSHVAEIWLSEASMVSSSLVAASFVSVSLASAEREFLGGSPLGPLKDGCGQDRDIDASDKGTTYVGSYFALAQVYPSCKVSKNEVRLSRSLACTLGNPSLGKITFVFPIQTHSTAGFLNGSDKLQYSYSTSDTHISFCNCKDLYLELAPSMHGVLKDDSMSEAHHDQVGSSPSSPRTPLSDKSQLNSRGSSNRTRDSNEVAFNTFNVGEALGNEKSRELLQTFASLWLRNRCLLPGNVVSIPMGGASSVFHVQGARPLSIESPSISVEEGKHAHPHNGQAFMPDHSNVAFLVDYRTKIHMNSSSSSITLTPSNGELSPMAPVRGKKKHTVASHVPKLGGLSKEYDKLKELIAFLPANGPLSGLGLKPVKGVLLHGPSGTGKTSLARSCVTTTDINHFEINGPEIIRPFHGETEQALHEIFDSARKASPAVIFIDELDAIAPARKDGGNELSQSMVATLLNLMDGISETEDVLVIAASNRPDSIDPALRRPGRLDLEIEIGVPSPNQRLDILNTLLNEMDHALVVPQIQNLASKTHGFVGGDLESLCKEAALVCLRRFVKLKNSNLVGSSGFSSVNSHNVTNHSSDLDPEREQIVGTPQNVDTISHNVSSEWEEKITFDDFEMAMRKVKPSAMREIILEIPNVRWGDVGGQAEVKQQLMEAVEWPQRHREDCERIGTRPPTGVLLYGPPGCSKTLMARAVASEAGLNFLSVKGPELFNKWVGESEKAVRSVFAKARANAPSVIFFDEIDSLATIRGMENDGASVSDRVISQLLVEMDGLQKRVDVTVIAATNRPDKIDPALLRPGRFDRLLYVGPPNEADREDIFRIHLRGMPCSSDVSMKELACITDGCSGADISNICRKAGLAALEESLEHTLEIAMAHFRVAVGHRKPTKIRSVWKSPLLRGLLTSCIVVPSSFFIGRWIHDYCPYVLFHKNT